MYIFIYCAKQSEVTCFFFKKSMDKTNIEIVLTLFKPFKKAFS